MSNPQPTRAEIYERIAQSSKQEVILDEMQRLGFWPKAEGQPQLAAELIHREGELQRELSELNQQLGVRRDPERALREMRKQRMKNAREKRETTKREQAKKRHERALAWHARRASHVGYLGPGVSAALVDGPLTQQEQEQTSRRTRDRAIPDLPRLARHGLPALSSAAQLAESMGVSVAELRFLSFHREVARTHHYHSFTLPKKTGGERLISAPMPRLKRAQYWVLDNVLNKIPAHEAAHGFLAGRSIISNAAPHAGQDVVINLDVKDFFPSIAFARIKGVFRQLGYGEGVATVLALLCSENRAQAWQVDGERLFVGGKARERVLPQGAPTSPMVTNLLCRRMDRRLQGLARQLGFVYTRYADDLTFSASGEAARDHVGKLLGRVRWILRDEGFTPHPDKERVMRKGRRQEVTGLVVNGPSPSVSRKTRRRLRAALHRASRSAADASTSTQAHWQGQQAQPSQLLGLAQFVHQINARQGRQLLADAQQLMRSPLDRANDALLAASRQDQRSASSSSPASFRALAAAGRAPVRTNGEPWWQPAAALEPVLEQTDLQRREARQLARHGASSASGASSNRRSSSDSHFGRGPQSGSSRQEDQGNASGRFSFDDAAGRDDQGASKDKPAGRLGTYWMQMVICFVMGSILHNRLITIFAMIAVIVLYYMRRQRWDVFMGVLVGL
ncbi:reverse transcriptase family protein [Diaphorobacter aerolatus]|uniref:RNA-directed DNA polymerase n=1 Tax=Diaphorobacter aerolatus TaxID=1288495 RepID=A0A7H0GMJ8_9BURK|nr:reverse transcriptase family protein [Diaphorobacter aerolatus]QNP49514.1 RNA-directed DNA polymerase [Diaphorobacter aerolatus]